MLLAGMLSLDENALICDLAETYQIYDYRSLPVKLVATLAAGLRENSRIRLKMAGVKGEMKEVLLATVADKLGLLLYMLGGCKGDKPESIAANYYPKQKKKREYQSFSTPEEFWEAMNKFAGGH